MTRHTIPLLLTLLLMPLMTQAREVRLANFGWRFYAGDIAEAFNKDFDDSNWREVNLPHDFQIEQPWVAPAAGDGADMSDPGNNVKSKLSPRGFKAMGIGWYRKTFVPDAAWQGKRVLVDFEGIMMVGDAYLNGTFIGKTDYGYLGFEADISKLLRWGEENVLAVRADTRGHDNSRWYTGGGLYRNVHFVVTDPTLFITRHGVHIIAKPDTIHIETEITCSERVRQLNVQVRLFDAEGNCVAEQCAMPVYRSNQKTKEYALPAMQIPHVHLWDIDDPYLYTAEVKLFHADGTLADSVTQRFGVRSVEFSPEFGMKLNGKKVILKGIANHNSMGALGAAAYPRAIRRHLQLLKDYGFNHIRTSHNPYSIAMLDMCDEMGILVVDELYDKWLSRYIGGRVSWIDQWQKDVPEWIKRDRNHPSIVFWSLGNELQTYWNIPFADWGVTPYRMQKELLKRYDDTRLITVAMHPRGRHQDTDSLPAPLVMETDIASYNYRYMYFPGDGKRFPWMMFYQSEASMAGFGPNYYEMNLDKVIGLAYWGAIDYLGESQGWPAKGWAQGCFAIDLTPKPTAALMKSIFCEEPVVGLCIQQHSQDIEWNGVAQKIKITTDAWGPHLKNHDEGLNLTTYTNCDEVELFVNGKSKGIQRNERENPKRRNQIRWQGIQYEAGSIEVVGRNGGKAVARYRSETPGEAVALQLESDNPTWTADGLDLQHIMVTAVDKKGRSVTAADAEVTFTVEGDASIVAVSSANHYSDELNVCNHRKLFNGQCLVILRAGRTSSKVKLIATAPGFKAVSKTFTIK